MDLIVRHQERLNDLTDAVNIITKGLHLIADRLRRLEDGEHGKAESLGEVPLQGSDQPTYGQPVPLDRVPTATPTRVLGGAADVRTRDNRPMGLRVTDRPDRVPGPESVGDPSPAELEDPLFDVIWSVIRRWDLQREYDALRSGATGTDVVAILRPLKAKLREMQPAILEGPDY